MNLQLSLKKKWFELTDTNGKTEDYREITTYWAMRLLDSDPQKNVILPILNYLDKSMLTNSIIEEVHYYDVCFKRFTTNTMTLGYPKSTDTARIKIFENAGIEIGYGREEWGAEPNKLYFIIKHGKRIQPKSLLKSMDPNQNF